MHDLLLKSAAILPELSVPAQNFFRMAYGILLFASTIMAARHGRRFFMSERWGGYAKSSWDVDLVQNPVVYPLLITAWLSCAALLIVGVWPVAAAFVNLLFCRYFFVHMRWKGILRGMGAPGFMTYWLAAVTFLLELSLHYANACRPLAVLVCQVDYAFIMLSAGIYKFTAGYPQNEGMELGMANPEWGYWYRFFSSLPTGHWIFRTCNHLAWSTEVVAGILMLIPPTRELGALLIIGSFIFIATQIRLALLTEMVMVGAVIFFAAGSTCDRVLAYLPSIGPAEAAVAYAPVCETLLTIGLLGYLVCLVPAHAGLFWNFYGKRALPGAWQRVLEAYTNFFGIIIWRVFSVDVVNFYVQIYAAKDADSERKRITDFSKVGGRFNHVAESITITSIFTSLKYYTSNQALFHERLLRYARTIPEAQHSLLIFQYVSMRKTGDAIAHIPVSEFHVDVRSGAIKEVTLEEYDLLRRAHAASPVREGVRPGSYVALGR